MPSQQEVRWSQLRIGVIVLVSAVILTTLLFLMTGSSGLGLFSRKLTITAYFENSSGLKDGAPVDLEGVTIGNVKSITVTTAPDRKLTPVVVTMKLNGDYQSDLHKDSIVSLTSNGVLGDEMVDINSSHANGPMLQDGDELKTKQSRSIQDIEDEGEAALDQMSIILAKTNSIMDGIQAGKGSLGQFLNNPDLYNNLNSTMVQVHTLAAKLNSNNNTLGKFMNDNGQMYDRLNDTVGNVDDISKDLQAGKGSLGKVLKDDAAYNNANESLKNLNAILADAQAGKGGLGMALKDPAFAKNLNDSLANLNTLLAGVNEGKGTLGKFVKDDTMNTNVNKLLTNTNDLITAMRQNPKKYLSIQLHIF